MITIMVDGQVLPADASSMRTMQDLVELIKATIDPDKIITSLTLEGAVLSDADWQGALTMHRGKTLEVSTGRKQEYLVGRLNSASDYLSRIIAGFEKAGESYRNGDSDGGNSALATSVDDLLAFINWYMALLSIDADRLVGPINEFNDHILGVQETCEQLLQQQMFQSWWALGETLRAKLEPKLAALQQFCQQTATTVSPH